MGYEKKLPITKELLEELYVNKTQQQIAEELGVSEKTIRRRFKEFNIKVGRHTCTDFIKKKKRLKRKKLKPKYQNREDFEKVYSQLKSLVLVAKHYNISLDTAFLWKKRHNIATVKGVSEEGCKKLREGKPYTNKEWLEEHYKTMTQKDIAILCNVGRDTINYWFRYHNIKTRNPKEQRQIKASYGHKFIFDKGFDKKTYLTIYENEGRITNNMLNFIKETVGSCQCCGYNEVLDLHHIDENRLNNKPENHLVCCPNCHAKIHRLGYTVNELCEFYTSWIDLV